VDRSVYAKMAQFEDCQLSAMDWIRSPLEVPIPTQRERTPEEPVGPLGKMRVDVDSRMNELAATGPVLKAGPMAPSTVVMATAARADRTRRENSIVCSDFSEG